MSKVKCFYLIQAMQVNFKKKVEHYNWKSQIKKRIAKVNSEQNMNNYKMANSKGQQTNGKKICHIPYMPFLSVEKGE